MKRKELIIKLQECANACFSCADACLHENDVSHMRDCIQTDQVCGSICLTTSKILSGSFKDIDDLIKYCAKICGICADECGKHSHEHCKKCAEACRACEEACQSFVSL